MSSRHDLERAVVRQSSQAAAGAGMVRLIDVSKTFVTVDATVIAAAGVSLEIVGQSIVALTGPSGSGKSTLLHLIGALDQPDAGSIHVDGVDVTRLHPRARADYRRSIGFVFQRFNLIPTLTVIDNVLLPTLPGRRHEPTQRRAEQLLEAVGLDGRGRTLATRLSGGQQQRVAIARALMNEPKLLLADEPTGNLDTATGRAILDLLFELRADRGMTILLATHDASLATRCDRIIQIRDGKILGASLTV